ncbi:MAG: hypothetical protein ACKOT0_03180 [bacterium]
MPVTFLVFVPFLHTMVFFLAVDVILTVMVGPEKPKPEAARLNQRLRSDTAAVATTQGNMAYAALIQPGPLVCHTHDAPPAAPGR